MNRIQPLQRKKRLRLEAALESWTLNEALGLNFLISFAQAPSLALTIGHALNENARGISPTRPISFFFGRILLENI
jgi:hypothetical protein